jgi:hypothetical protein
MTELLNITESTFDGVTVRSHADYPMFRVTADGRVVGARGFWLKPKPQAVLHPRSPAGCPLLRIQLRHSKPEYR